jgi:hypothetical protein
MTPPATHSFAGDEIRERRHPSMGAFQNNPFPLDKTQRFLE